MKQVLDQDKKEAILRLKTKDWTWRKIAEAVNASVNTVKSFYKRQRELATLPPKEKHDHRLIQGVLARKIKDIVLENPQISYRDIVGKLREYFGDDRPLPSYTTVWRFLNDSGYLFVKLVKKPLLSEKNRAKRIEFSSKNISNPEEFWEWVIWSDETMVRSNPNSKDMFFKVHKNFPKADLPYNTKTQNQGVSVMFWGCFSKQGLGPLVPIDGTMDSTKYLNILRDYVVPLIHDNPHSMLFMQDNAPCHKSRAVSQFLADNEITVLDWPPQSPDLNPIENLWSIVKARRAKKFNPPTSRQELIDQVYKIWSEIDSDLRKNLADSAINRLKECLRRNGKQTKY